MSVVTPKEGQHGLRNHHRLDAGRAGLRHARGGWSAMRPDLVGLEANGPSLRAAKPAARPAGRGVAPAGSGAGRAVAAHRLATRRRVF